MFVIREHPNSVSITPSRGDGGVETSSGAPDRTAAMWCTSRISTPSTQRDRRRTSSGTRWVRLPPTGGTRVSRSGTGVCGLCETLSEYRAGGAATLLAS